MIPEPFVRDRTGADGLVAGYYLLRRADRVDVPIRIWFGPPHDPDTGEEMDRSLRWQVEINGILAHDPEYPPLVWGRAVETLEGIWPECGRFPTDELDYRYRVERAEWAEQHDPSDPFGSRTGKIDPMTAALPLFD